MIKKYKKLGVNILKMLLQVTFQKILKIIKNNYLFNKIFFSPGKNN